MLIDDHLARPVLGGAKNERDPQLELAQVPLTTSLGPPNALGFSVRAGWCHFSHHSAWASDTTTSTEASSSGSSCAWPTRYRTPPPRSRAIAGGERRFGDLERYHARAAGRELASKPAATIADIQHVLASWLDSRSSLDHDDHRARHPIG